MKTTWEKFKKWLNYNRPHAATMDGWREFDSEFRKNAPIRYLLVETIPSIKDRVAMKIRSMVEYVLYRTTKKYHVVNTSLEPRYYDKDTLMLHACFSLLVDFVEVECAHMYRITHEFSRHFGQGKQKSFLKRSWEWFSSKFKRRGYGGIPPLTFRKKNRNKEDGIKYLEMQIDEAHNDGDYHNELVKKQILSLYLWWTEERANRKSIEEPPEIQNLDRGISALFSNKIKEEQPEAYAVYMQYLDDLNTQEEDWCEEDNEMLAKLVAIRASLWT